MANLLDEEVADFLKQHCEPPRGAVGLACGPDQTHHVEQSPKPRLHFWKLQAFQDIQVVGEWLQVCPDVLCLCQSWKEWEMVTFPAWGPHPPSGSLVPGTEGSGERWLPFLPKVGEERRKLVLENFLALF